MNRTEVLTGFDRLAKRMFSEAAHARWSDNDPNVIEIHTGQISADVTALSRFNTACNRQCWITTDSEHKVILCREV